MHETSINIKLIYAFPILNNYRKFLSSLFSYIILSIEHIEILTILSLFYPNVQNQSYGWCISFQLYIELKFWVDSLPIETKYNISIQ